MNKRLKIMTVVVLAIICVFFGIIVTVDGINKTNNSTIIETVATASQNKLVQEKLRELGYYSGSIDGVIGARTTSAVKRFQSDYGLVADGIIGAKTLSALGLGGSSLQTSSDVYLLAKCIHAEARGEPYVGQVAVGAVVLNRVASPQFPNSISGVVFQPWAFTATHDGQIDLEPNDSAYSAARDALNGWDPTNGCLYYYNPSSATSKWIFSRQVVLTIGKHVFAL